MHLTKTVVPFHLNTPTCFRTSPLATAIGMTVSMTESNKGEADLRGHLVGVYIIWTEFTVTLSRGHLSLASLVCKGVHVYSPCANSRCIGTCRLWPRGGTVKWNMPPHPLTPRTRSTRAVRKQQDLECMKSEGSLEKILRYQQCRNVMVDSVFNKT